MGPDEGPLPLLPSPTRAKDGEQEINDEFRARNPPPEGAAMPAVQV